MSGDWLFNWIEAMKAGSEASGNRGHRGFPGHGGSSATGMATASSLASAIRNKSEEEEPALTELITSTVAEQGGEMVYLEHRLKTKESLERKIKKDVKEKGVTESKAAADISDAVRYTAIYDSGNLVAKAKVTQSALEDQGWEKYDSKWKNYFGPGDAYDGYNCVFRHKKTGQRFELQFHTKASHKIKESNHKIYEKSRKMPASPARTVLENQMTTAWDKYSRPAGWQDLPGVTMGPAGAGKSWKQKDETRYFSRLDENPDSEDYMEKMSLHRWYVKDDVNYMERWDGKKWVDNPELIWDLGMGGESDMVEITEAEAEEFLGGE